MEEERPSILGCTRDGEERMRSCIAAAELRLLATECLLLALIL